MRKILKLSLILIFIATFTLVIIFYGSKKEVKAAVPSFPAQGLYPSVRLADYIVGDQGAIDWGATVYDWIISAPPPIDNWYAKPEYNDNLKLGRYFEWTIFNLLDDGSGSSHSEQTAQWYDENAIAGSDWEGGYLHVSTQDTYFPYDTSRWGGLSNDSKLRYVFRNTSTTNNANAIWDGNASLSLATRDDAIYFGRLDRFAELNLEYSTLAGSAWNGAWEYWNGSTWTTLTLLSDTTNDSQANGQIKFNPPSPSQWKRTKVNGSPTFWGDQGVYFIRLRTSATGSPSPVLKKAFGRNYWIHGTTDAGQNGYPDGNTVPAWDPRNDNNGDGYVGSGEGTANTLATAKFKYEARVPGSWAWTHFLSDPGNTAVSQTFVANAVENMNADNSATHRFIGAYIDNMFGMDNFSDELRSTGRVLEYPNLSGTNLTAAWRDDIEQRLILGKDVFHANGYLLGGNTGYQGIAQFSQHFDYVLREGGSNFIPAANKNCGSPNWNDHILPAGSTPEWMLRSDQGKYNIWQMQLGLYTNMAAKVDQSPHVVGVNGTQIIGSGTHWTQTVQPGSSFTLNSKFAEVDRVVSDTEIILKTAPYTSSDIGQYFNFMTIRDKMAGFSGFLTIQKPDTDYLQLWQGVYYHGSMSKWENWIPAITLDYGQPTGIVPTGKEARGTRGTYIIQTGDDPTNPETTYNPYIVFARDYTKSLALFRPPSCGASFFDNSALNIQLPTNDTWYPVDYYGNISVTPVTQVSMKNVDGAIFMKGSAMTGVTLSKSADKTSVKSGDTLTYTINYKVGNQNATNVNITDNLSSNATYVTGSGKLNGVSKTDVADSDGYSFASNKATWMLGSLLSGASGNVSFQVRMN